ncbi:MAG: DUF1330 domain-containing protein [Flavobacteriales bacterium]|nr:DUF1330 domain-containing protein [Flavobacteriales bacterium]
MKTRKMITALLFGTISISATACSNTNNENTEADTISTSIEAPEEIHVETNEVLFKKGKLIEVAFLSIKEGMGKQLKEDYFPKVMPIVTEYGGKALMKIGVQNNYSEEIKAQVVVFFEWPSVARKEAFDKDPRYLKVKKIRDAALSYLKQSYFEVEKDSPVKLDGTKFYEVYGMSMNKKNGHLMNKYFEKAGPIVTKEYDVEFALALKPVKVKGGDYYVPQTFGLAIWPSAEANAQFFNSSEYQAIKHYKEAALERIDVWQGAVVFNK